MSPQRPAKVCSGPGCRARTFERFCPDCKRKYHQGDARRRGTAAERGYDGRWRTYRARYLRLHPICAACTRGNRVTKDSMANVVDHVRPVTGPTDPGFWDERNHQALCTSCHNAKTRRDMQAGRTKGSGGQARRRTEFTAKPRG